MANDNNGPEAAYPGPADQPGSGKQGGGGAGSQQRPEDWNPPPGNPGSDQDSQVPRDNGTARTAADGAEEDMPDVDAANSVSTEHPQPQ